MKPDTGQEHQLARIAGVCRLVWNLCLEQRKTVYASRRITLNSYRQLPDVTILRGEYDWIQEIPSQVLQQKVRDLDIAYKNFFEGRAAFPEQKKKGKSVDSFRFPQGFKIDNRRIFLPKIGWVGFFKSQGITGKPKHMTVSRNGKHWFVSVCCGVDIADAVPKSKTVGIDMGIAKLCALSDGTIVENPKIIARYSRRMAKLQRRLSRKVKHSNNFLKQKVKITAAGNILRAGHARLACGEIGAVRPLGEAGTLKAA